MAGKPTWRKAFDRVERAVGKPLEDAVGSQRYVDAVVLGFKVQMAVNRKVRQTVDRQIGAALHMVNVPTYRDVRRLSKQLSTLTGEVRTLATQTDEIAAAAAALQERQAEQVRAEPDPAEDGRDA